MATITQVTERPLSGLNHIDALLGSGVPWNFIGRDTIHYSFALPVGTGTTGQILDPATITAFNTAQAAQVRALLAYISQLTGIRFEEWAVGDQADLHFGNARLFDGYTSQNVTSMSYANQGEQAVGLTVDAWIYLDAFSGVFDNQSPAPGGIGYQSLLHELGHVLGLKHPFEGAQQLPLGNSFGQDNTLTTVMSNTDIGAPISQFAAYDLAALAWLYGGDGLGGNYGVGAPGKWLVGSFGNDEIRGGGGNDMIAPGEGDDSVDGGDGSDTVVYFGARSAYSVRLSGEIGVWTIVSFADGTDQVRNVETFQFSDGTFSAAATLNGFYQFFVAAFAAAPGVEYMNQLADAYNFGLSLKEIVNIFTTKSQFTSVYPLSLSNQQLATQLVSNIVKNSATEQAKAEAVHDIEGALAVGWTRGDVIYTVFGNLAAKPVTDPTWGNTAQQFLNQIAVARYYTEVMHQSTTDLPTLRAVVGEVTPFTDVSTPEAIATLIGVELSHLQVV